MATHKLTPEERIARFWSYVDVRGPDECWPWTGAGGRQQKHGRFTYNGRLGMADHFSWILANGPIPDGLWVLHKCDNPPCVNPAHLFLGTQYDNIHDCLSKGRGRRSGGERHWKARLTTDDVGLIRSSSERAVVLAERFGVCIGTINYVRSGRGWRR